LSPGPSRPGRGCGCLAGLAVLVLAWSAAGLFSSLEKPREETRVEAPPPHGPEPALETLPETWKSNVGALREFSRAEAGPRYRLRFGFIDYNGRSHDVSCLVDRKAHAAERARFGFDSGTVNAEVDLELSRLVDTQLSARGLGPYLRVEFYGGGGYRWSWNLPAGTPAGARARALSAIEELKQWIDRELPAHSERIRAEVYRRHGVLLKGNTLSIDYEKLIDEGTDPLSDCFQVLRASGRGSGVRPFMGLLLAFYQELKYEVPPDEEEGRQTLGLRVPTDVLVSGRGDCDSKSVAFAAMWRRFPSRVVFIVVPGHALVGVEAPALGGERTVRVGNRSFVLCEVAGPAKLSPGTSDVKGSFEYILIDPA